MKKLKLLRLQFENEIEEYEIPAFRAAIAKKVGKENILFHYHLDDKTNLHRYPLIQYKRINKHPSVICLEEGADEVNRFLTNKNWSISIGNKNIELKILKLDLNQFNLQVWDKNFTYKINNWIALNNDNYSNFLNTSSLADRVSFLEKTLIAHIISFAEGVKWNIDKQINLVINEIHKQRWVKYKGVGFIGFDISFTTNVFLPDYIGLGKAVSVGFGVVKKIKKGNSSSAEISEEIEENKRQPSPVNN